MSAIVDNCHLMHHRGAHKTFFSNKIGGGRGEIPTYFSLIEVSVTTAQSWHTRTRLQRGGGVNSKRRRKHARLQWREPIACI